MALLTSYNITVNLTLRNSLTGFTKKLVVLVFRPFGIKSCVRTTNRKKAIDRVAIICAILLAPSGGHVAVPGNSVAGTIVEGCSTRGAHHISLAFYTSCSYSVRGIGDVVLGITKGRRGMFGSPTPFMETAGRTRDTVRCATEV